MLVDVCVRFRSPIVLGAAVALLVSCGGSDQAAPGAEGGACNAGACDTGLACESDVCVVRSGGSEGSGDGDGDVSSSGDGDGDGDGDMSVSPGDGDGDSASGGDGDGDGDAPPVCNPEQCNGQDDDCDSVIDEDTAGTDCSAVGGSAACEGGVCVVASCDQGFDDCDGLYETGCEASLDSTATCGDCETECGFENAIAACVDSACQPAGCIDGFFDCDGSPDVCETVRSPTNCEACGSRCHPLNALGDCSDGVCGIGECFDGWADCDGDVDNGCESNLTDVATCGDCNMACPALPTPVGCGTGECRGPICPPGTAACNPNNLTCYFDLSHDATCGACNVQCAFDQGIDGHGTVACTAIDPEPGHEPWGCIVTCAGGYQDCDGNYRNGCEVAPGDPNGC